MDELTRRQAVELGDALNTGEPLLMLQPCQARAMRVEIERTS
jgi:hypothetical protein